MYPEFIAIYIGLIIAIGLLVAILVLMLKNRDNSTGKPVGNYVPKQKNYEVNVSQSGSIVFCKNCAAEFDASQKFCPKCGTPR